jgi:hypothetical protein
MTQNDAVDALVTDPLGFIQRAFARSTTTTTTKPTDEDWGVRETALELTRCEEKFNALPEINAHGGVETIQNNALVRFRGLVQDMYEPEYYVGAYERANGDEKTWVTTKYAESTMDDVNGGIGESVLFERRVLYCVPVPGERRWVGERERATMNERAASEDAHGEKRAREEEAHMDVCADANVMTPTTGAAMLIRPDIERVKKASAGDRTAPDTPEQIGEEEVHEESLDQLLNFPLIPESRSPCIVKLYGETDDSLKLNDVVEFVGMLYYAPELGVEKRDQQMEDSPNAALYASSAFPEEDASKNPVTSLVPRFHALAYKVTSQNKFVNSTPVERFSETEMETSHKLSPEQVNSARSKLLDMLTNVLGGDVFAAELVLMTLISRVHTRTDMLTLGKFSVNLTGCKLDSCETGTISEMLSTVIGQVCPSTAHLPVTVPALNARSWSPKKDYVYNRLRSGPLQLAASTVLLLDETKLEAGTLTEIGIRNVDALKSLSTLQDLEYDFQYHQMRMPVDVPLIILSDTKSIIPADVIVPLRRVRQPKVIETTEDELAIMRAFVSGARMTKHTISEQTSADIETEIVAARKNDKALTQEVLHLLLTMARLHALALGGSEVTKQTWIETVEINRRVAERNRVV